MTPFAERPYRVGVGAVLLMSEAPAAVFTGLRCDIPDAWQMPQGGVDDGETPLQALYRELEEETSIRSVQLLDRPPIDCAYDFPPEIADAVADGRFRGQSQTWYLLRFIGRPEEINVTTAHPEFSEWQPMTPQALLARAPGFKRGLYETVFAHFSAHLR